MIEYQNGDSNLNIKEKGVLEWTIPLSNIKAGLLLRTFKTREAKPMMKMFNSFIRSKMGYCCVIWNPVKKKIL